jgi:branched-chain amino acid transport system substrate-binding protein
VLEDVDLSRLLKIGFAVPLTGWAAPYGDEFKRGAELAVSELQDPSISVVFEDTQLEVKKAVDAVTKLVNVDKVNALAVSAYLEAAGSHQISDAKNIPLIVMWDSNPQLESMGNNVFAIGPWTPASGEVTAEFSYNNLNAKKAAIFGYQQEWSVDVSKAFAEKFKSLGGTIVAQEMTAPGARDYRTNLSKIVTAKPDVIYVTVEDLFTSIKQARELGYKGAIINSDTVDNELAAKNPEVFNGIYTSQVADPAFKETDHYIAAYKKKYGEDPKKVLYGTWGYDAVNLIVNASKNNKTIQEGLYATQNYKGASGTISFNKEGSSKTIPAMFTIKDGKVVKVEE